MELADLPRDCFAHIAPVTDATHRAALACTCRAMYALLRPQVGEPPLIWPGQALNRAICDQHVPRVRACLGTQGTLSRHQIQLAVRTGALDVIAACWNSENAAWILEEAVYRNRADVLEDQMSAVCNMSIMMTRIFAETLVWGGMEHVPSEWTYVMTGQHMGLMLLTRASVATLQWLTELALPFLRLQLQRVLCTPWVSHRIIRQVLRHASRATLVWLFHEKTGCALLPRRGRQQLVTKALCVIHNAALAEWLSDALGVEPDKSTCARKMAREPAWVPPPRWAPALMHYFIQHNTDVATIVGATSPVSRLDQLWRVVPADPAWLQRIVQGAIAHRRADVLAWVRTVDVTLATFMHVSTHRCNPILWMRRGPQSHRHRGERLRRMTQIAWFRQWLWLHCQLVPPVCWDVDRASEWDPIMRIFIVPCFVLPWHDGSHLFTNTAPMKRVSDKNEAPDAPAPKVPRRAPNPVTPGRVRVTWTSFARPPAGALALTVCRVRLDPADFRMPAETLAVLLGARMAPTPVGIRPVPAGVLDDAGHVQEDHWFTIGLAWADRARAYALLTLVLHDAGLPLVTETRMRVHVRPDQLETHGIGALTPADLEEVYVAAILADMPLGTWLPDHVDAALRSATFDHTPAAWRWHGHEAAWVTPEGQQLVARLRAVDPAQFGGESSDEESDAEPVLMAEVDPAVVAWHVGQTVATPSETPRPTPGSPTPILVASDEEPSTAPIIVSSDGSSSASGSTTVPYILVDSQAPEHEKEDAKEKEEEAGVTTPTLCCVCLDAPADTLVLPCMHQVVCRACSPQLTQTPQARYCLQCTRRFESVVMDEKSQ
jgi:hypothetical protein